MNTHKSYSIKINTISAILIIICCLMSLQSCKSDKKQAKHKLIKIKKDNPIEIITYNMDFQSPDTINSGWNTFRYTNNSPETHFFILDRYPKGKTIADTRREIYPPFDAGMDLINKGKTKEGFAEFKKLPKWFFKVVSSGGSGLLSPNHSSLTTLNLKPGYYIMECYVKAPDGKFHSSMGMVKSLFVTDKNSKNTTPVATINISISSTEGITYNDTIKSGLQTFSVSFKDQITHENFVGHDVNLVILSKNTDLDSLAAWMNWVSPKGLINPSPASVTFLGGINDMPAGSTGYFTANLKPGKYAFVSEVPNAISKNMLKTFIVSK